MGPEGSSESAGELPGADLMHFHWFCLGLAGLESSNGLGRRVTRARAGGPGNPPLPPSGLLVKLRFFVCEKREFYIENIVILEIGIFGGHP